MKVILGQRDPKEIMLAVVKILKVLLAGRTHEFKMRARLHLEVQIYCQVINRHIVIDNQAIRCMHGIDLFLGSSSVHRKRFRRSPLGLA